MSYTEDAVKAKLSSLNETQESIVTVAQWVMFHRRYADKTAALWLQRLKDSGSPKRLNLIYLANEVVQQSKARKKEDFLVAFSPIIAEATGTAAKGATNDVQQKLRRVSEVWRQRQIFELRIQEDIEARMDEIDKSQPRTSGAPSKKPVLGGSLFSTISSDAPAELQSLIPLQHALSKALLDSKPLATKAQSEYATLSEQPAPAPPIHAARLNLLIKTLASTQVAVAESLRTRQALIAALEKLIETNRAEMAAESTQHVELGRRKAAMFARRNEVEIQIQRGLPTKEVSEFGPENETNTAAGGAALNSYHANAEEDVARPEIESFTPPPMESTTPPGLPLSGDGVHLDGAYTTKRGNGNEFERPDFEELTPPPMSPPMSPPHLTYPDATPSPPSGPAGIPAGIIRAAADARKRPLDAFPGKARVSKAGSSSPGANGHSNGYIPNLKRRKTSLPGGEEEGLTGADAMDGLDADVVGMLGDK